MVKNVSDYVDDVQKKFPFLTKVEINKIITYGLKKYATANKMHADVLLQNLIDEPMTAFCGRLGVDALQHYRRFIVKNRMRERCLFKFRKEKWDGYYYIGLTDEQQKNLKKRGKTVYFKNVYLTKLRKELYHLPFVKHLWRVPMIEDLGWRFFKEDFKTDNACYIGENQYANYHQCFLGRFNNRHTPTSSNEPVPDERS